MSETEKVYKMFSFSEGFCFLYLSLVRTGKNRYPTPPARKFLPLTYLEWNPILHTHFRKNFLVWNALTFNCWLFSAFGHFFIKFSSHYSIADFFLLLDTFFKNSLNNQLANFSNVWQSFFQKSFTFELGTFLIFSKTIFCPLTNSHWERSNGNPY